jgi:hypothetical protein
MKQKQQKFDILKNFYENEIRQLQKHVLTHWSQSDCDSKRSK